MTDTTEVLTGARLENGAVVGGRTEHLTQDEINRRFAEISTRNDEGFSTVLASKAAVRQSADRLASAGKSLKATILSTADSLKVTTAFAASKTLLRSIAGRAAAAASKVGTICSPGMALAAVLVSKDVRHHLGRVLKPAAAWTFTAGMKAAHYLNVGLKKVGLGRPAAWLGNMTLAGMFFAASAFKQGVAWLDGKQDSGAFRWARFALASKLYSNLAKAFIPAQYRTVTYVLWLLWMGGRSQGTSAPRPFPVASSAEPKTWSLREVSILGPTTGEVFDADEFTTDRGDLVYRITLVSGVTRYFTEDELDGKVVPRGSVTLGTERATSDVALREQRRPRPPVKRAPVTKSEAPKGTSTPKQAKKRPRKPPVVVAAKA